MVLVAPKRGPQGLPGAQGAPGPAGGDPYIHTQGAPSTTWTVTHNLGRYPTAVRLIGPDDEEFMAPIRDDSVNQLTVLLSAPTYGKVQVI